MKTNFFWRRSFTLKKVYKDFEWDLQGENHTDKDTLLLLDDNDLRAYVDKDQFVEVDKNGMEIKKGTLTYYENGNKKTI